MSLTTPTLGTPRLRLRPFRAFDAADVFAVQSDAEALRYWDSPPWRDPSQAERFLAGCRTMADQGVGVRPAVERLDDGAFVGWLTLTGWDPGNRSASLGFSFSRQVWGRGYATEAARALLTWAYDTLDLNRVQAEADTRNDASRRVLEKLGFILEGTLREDCVVDGVVSDSWVFGLLRRDWTA